MVTVPVFASAPYAEIKEEITLPNELQRICSCESTGSPNNEPVQFNPDGTTLVGRINSDDKGACQINSFYWGDTAEKLGLDYINSKEDNYKLALHIYQENGSQPWFWSKGCWK